jgi:hypothetical protein
MASREVSRSGRAASASTMARTATSWSGRSLDSKLSMPWPGPSKAATARPRATMWSARL